MRSKAHRYNTSLVATFANSTEIVSVTGDFDGGIVLANAHVYAAPGAGGWISATFMVDGVAQGPMAWLYQSGGSVTIIHSWMLRLTQGRHRVSVLFGTSAAPMASCQAALTVAELNA